MLVGGVNLNIAIIYGRSLWHWWTNYER